MSQYYGSQRNRMRRNGLDSFGSGSGQVVISSGHRNELSSLIKFWKYLKKLSNY
jgi:hypothetical protein